MIVLTMKDEKRLVVTQKVMDGTMDIIEGARVLSFSERQMYRLMEQVRERWPLGVMHGNRKNQHARKYDANGSCALTQFGRACQALGITMIKAYSPQAKGRIERLWGTFQDRLVFEMRLEKIKTREEANLFL
jgi:hypothetical protein